MRRTSLGSRPSRRYLRAVLGSRPALSAARWLPISPLPPERCGRLCASLSNWLAFARKHADRAMRRTHAPVALAAWLLVLGHSGARWGSWLTIALLSLLVLVTLSGLFLA